MQKCLAAAALRHGFLQAETLLLRQPLHFYRGILFCFRLLFFHQGIRDLHLQIVNIRRQTEGCTRKNAEGNIEGNEPGETEVAAQRTKVLARGDLVALGLFVRLARAFARAFAQAAVTPLAALEVGNRLQQMNAAEVRPQTLGDEDFGVRHLP